MADAKGVIEVAQEGVHRQGPSRRPTSCPIVVSLAEQARREGLLALEDSLKDIDDPFLVKGVTMAIDGTDPEELRDILEAEVARQAAPPTSTARSSSPTSAPTPRPSASSAPSWAWCTCWRTSPSPRSSAT